MTAPHHRMNGKRAVLLLGHGSKLKEANDTLMRIASAVEAVAGYDLVLPAFLQMERPDFQEAVDTIVSQGFKDITVMPYFLYPGAHVTKDLPHEIDEAGKRHGQINFTVTRGLGFHDRLVDVTIERIEEAFDKAPEGAREFAQHPIEKESFRILGAELNETGLSPLELPIVKRVIHSTADFDFKDMLRFGPGGIEAGVRAIRAGGSIVTDVRMVEAGITKARLTPFGNRVLCFSADADVASKAAIDGITKAAASMRKAAPHMEGGIVAVGNAPTALAELLRLVKDGAARPALIIGVPVGFVGAVEAKEGLVKSGLAYIATAGRKGGSTVAVAIVNALAIAALAEAAC